MFYPTILPLLQFFAYHPEGVSRGKVRERLSHLPPDEVGAALGWVLKAGLVEERGDFLVLLPPLPSLARKMERLTTLINRQDQARDQTLAPVRMILGGG